MIYSKGIYFFNNFGIIMKTISNTLEE